MAPISAIRLLVVAGAHDVEVAALDSRLALRASISPPPPPGFSPSRPLPRQLSSRWTIAATGSLDHLEAVDLVEAERQLLAGHRQPADQDLVAVRPR